MKAQHAPGLAARWVDDLDEGQPGQFDVVTEPSGQRRFWFVCPGPCKSIAALALRPVLDGSPQSWDFDGDLEATTLSPSINHVGCWHGWLRAGVFSET